MRFEYSGRKFITDPYLAAKHSRPSFTGKSPNPLVDLPCSPREAIAGMDLAVISHLHSDHFDPLAQELLPKDTVMICQPEDAEAIKKMGFVQIQKSLWVSDKNLGELVLKNLGYKDMSKLDDYIKKDNNFVNKSVEKFFL